MIQGRLVPLAACAVLASPAYCQDGAPAPFASMRAKEVFEQFLNTLGKAKSIQVTYDAQRLGNASERYEVTLARPNLAHIKGRAIEIILDGSQIAVLNKIRKTYYTLPENPENIRNVFTPFEVAAWRYFLQPASYKAAYQIRSAGTKIRKGMAMQVIEIQGDQDSLQTATLYTDPQDNLLRQAEFVRQEPKSRTITLVDIRDLKLDVETKPEDFTFTVPDGYTFVAPQKKKG